MFKCGMVTNLGQLLIETSLKKLNLKIDIIWNPARLGFFNTRKYIYT